MVRYTDLVLERTSKLIYNQILCLIRKPNPIAHTDYHNIGKNLQIIFKTRDYPFIYIFILYRNYTIMRFVHDARFNVNTQLSIFFRTYKPYFNLKLFKMFGFDIDYSLSRFYINGQKFIKKRTESTIEHTIDYPFPYNFPVIENLKL